jgi:hypothetical protein
MKAEDYLQILKDSDDPRYAEFPGGYNKQSYDDSIKRFLKLAEQVKSVLGSECVIESGDKVQDASFIGEVLLPTGVLQEPMKSPADFGANLRVSNFGDLATISEELPINEDILDRVVSLIRSAGYRYVPYDVLTTPYTGTNPGVTGYHNWYHRFFDFI